MVKGSLIKLINFQKIKQINKKNLKKKNKRMIIDFNIFFLIKNINNNQQSLIEIIIIYIKAK